MRHRYQANVPGMPTSTVGKLKIALLTLHDSIIVAQIGQSIYAKLWLDPPQLATEAFSSDFLPESLQNNILKM